MISFDDERLRSARDKWQYSGQIRPPFAETPRPGQRSVWDFPRPPAIGPDSREVLVRCRGETLAATRRALTVCETASPPTWYIPLQDIRAERLRAVPGPSVCEWKGVASYYDIVVDGLSLPRVAWTYASPFPGAEALNGHFAFYPHQLECFVTGEPVQPQPGHLYAGWVTNDVCGPFKGAPGTEWW